MAKLPKIPPPLAAVARSSVFSQLGSPFLYSFLFLAYSRVGEFAFPRLHLPLITASIACVFAILNRGLQRILTSPAGLLLIGFSGWLAVCTPFSYWKGGSFDLLFYGWAKSMMLFIMIVGLVETRAQCLRAMLAIAVGVLAISLMCLFIGDTSMDRLALPIGMLQNPNDLAQILLIGLPFWLVLTMERNRMPFGRVLAMFPIVPILAVIAHTGSRSALVALAVLGLIVLRNASLVNRIRLGLLGVSLIVVAFAVLPGTTLDRYVTVLGDPGAPETYLSPFEVSTVASSQQRITLFKESVRLTLANPVLGVGPGQFQSYSANDAGRDNKLALWRETHCAYTQISSEAGIPALILYLGAMLYCFKRSYSLYNATRHLPGLRDLGTISYALLLSHVSYAVTALFSSVAYKMFFPTLAAFTVVVLRIADSEMRASQPPASAGTPAAAPATKWFTGRQTRQSRFRP